MGCVAGRRGGTVRTIKPTEERETDQARQMQQRQVLEKLGGRWLPMAAVASSRGGGARRGTDSRSSPRIDDPDPCGAQSCVLCAVQAAQTTPAKPHFSLTLLCVLAIMSLMAWRAPWMVSRLGATAHTRKRQRRRGDGRVANVERTDMSLA